MKILQAASIALFFIFATTHSADDLFRQEDKTDAALQKEQENIKNRERKNGAILWFTEPLPPQRFHPYRLPQNPPVVSLPPQTQTQPATTPTQARQGKADRFKCPCGKKCNTGYAFYQHAKIAITERCERPVYSCEKCKYGSNEQEDFDRHRQLEHSAEKNKPS